MYISIEYKLARIALREKCLEVHTKRIERQCEVVKSESNFVFKYFCDLGTLYLVLLT